MCTALTLLTSDHYFGRNLDLEYSYHETVTVTPRRFVLPFRHMRALSHHYAIIGMAYVQHNYPLYYDATNEFGLSMAGLNFPGNAHYTELQPGKYNIPPFELIPWLLGQCKNLAEVRPLLKHLNICNTPFSDQLPPTDLHWIISDQIASITLEATNSGLHIHENCPGILTNNPPFDYHMTNLANYMGLCSAQPKNHLSSMITLHHYSRGMGGLGLPGDLSSASRFVRAAFFKANSHCGNSEEESVGQFFHILDSVAHIRGSVEVSPGAYEITVHSSCCNMDKGIYYYKTYENSQISAVDLHHTDLDGTKLISYPLRNSQKIFRQN